MPGKKVELVALTPEQLSEIPGFKRTPVFEAQYPKKTVTAAEAKAAQAKWLASVAAPKVEQPAAKPIKAVMLTASHVTALRAITESEAPTAALIAQEMSPEDLLGVAYSAFVTFNYTKLASENKKRSAAARTTAAATAQWKQVIDGATGAFAAAGLKNLKEADLDKMAAELGRNKANFNAVATMANSAVAAPLPDTARVGIGNFVTQTAVLAVGPVVISAPANLCSQPLAQGSYTKHFGKTFSLQVSFNAPCIPKFWKTCHYTVTIASLSYNVDLNVGYKITCCGASAWGQAAAQVCGSVLGHTACASCTASIIGVAGLSKNAIGGQCSYGLGVTASLQCKVGSWTVLNVSAPFGWSVQGPCPPLNLPC